MNALLREGLATLERRALLARIFIIAVAVLSVAHALGVAGVLQGALTGPSFFVGDYHVVDLIGGVMALTLLGSFIVVGMWIHRAHANLEAADLPALEYTPGWSIGWFAVPIANFFKPFQAMRELWNASHGALGDYSEAAPGLLWVWWLCWILSSVGGFGDTYTNFDVIGLLCNAVSAGALLMIVNAVTTRQHSMDIAEAFA